MALRPQDRQTRILVADSQAVIRLGVRLALEENAGMRVVAEACDVDSAFEAAAAAKPDIAVVEMELPGETSSETIRRFLDQPSMKLVLLSSSNDPDALAGALSLGVPAILSKSSPMLTLVDAIRAIRRGRKWTPPQLAARLEGEAPPEEEDAWARLTPRERAVADLVARGMPYRQVAEQLDISDHTVKNHLRRIYDKLDINSRVELAVHGARGGE